MFRIEFKTDNAFFEDNPGEAVAQLLHGVADKVDQGQTDGYVYDGNGNKVGNWYLDHETGED